MKTKSVLIIIATLIIGFIIGFLTNGQLTKNRIQRFVKQDNCERFKSRLIHVIQPDDSQFEVIEPIIDEFTRKVHQSMRESRKGFNSMHDEMVDKLKPYLEPEQINRLEETHRRYGKPWDSPGKPQHQDGSGPRPHRR
nr:hypothetical protein [Bacteroidota bacterium]